MDKDFVKKEQKRMFIGCLIIALILFLAISIFNTNSQASADLNPDIDYLMVVNDSHPYVFGSTYDTAIKNSLVYLPDSYGEATPVEFHTAQAFLDLQAELLRQGMVISLYSGYRSDADQQAVYDYYSSLEGWSETNKVSKPGYSEHHTGLLLNVMIWYAEPDTTPQWYTETAERQATIPEFAKLHETLADFGFIDRYPLGKEQFTGCPSMPYEIRYVGDPFIAHQIMDKALCLEEYLAQNT